MLLFPPPKFRKRRGGATAPTPPPPQVVVVSVVLMNFHQVRFVFSEPVTCDGAGNEQIIIQTEVGPDVPVESEQVDATTILFWFDSGFVVAGNFWNLIAAPDGLDFQGRTCAAPQGGVVE